MVGRVHNCRPVSQPDVANTEESMANKPQTMANTYKYRDPESRRAYMKHYMRNRRAGLA